MCAKRNGYKAIFLLFFRRCPWFVRPLGDREAAGEVPVRPGGLLPLPLPFAAVPLRSPPGEALFPEAGLPRRRAAALLLPPGGTDAHRHPHQGHGSQQQQHLLHLCRGSRGGRGLVVGGLLGGPAQHPGVLAESQENKWKDSQRKKSQSEVETKRIFFI